MAHTTEPSEKRDKPADSQGTGPENPDHPGDLTPEEKALAEEMLKP